MAENAANFTFTTLNRPSIFEIIAQKSLNDTLHPALQKIALFLHGIDHEKFSLFNKYYDETFLVVSGVLQYYYLKNYDSSFSECFYGLQRRLLSGDKLKLEDRWMSFAFLVVLPYIKRKCEERLELYRTQAAEGSLSKDLKGKFKTFLIHFHSLTEVTICAWTLHTFLLYMSNKSQSQLPALKVLDLKLGYCEEIADVPNFWSALFKGQIRSFNFDVFRQATAGLLETTAFFLQFLQVWNSQMSNYSISSLPRVEPPSTDNKAKSYQGKCPLCLQVWKIPSVLPASGYIYCFKCILTYLRETDQRCPVTDIPAQPRDIVILYDNE